MPQIKVEPEPLWMVAKGVRGVVRIRDVNGVYDIPDLGTPESNAVIVQMIRSVAKRGNSPLPETFITYMSWIME